jgi:hypothetical protein
MEIRNIWQFFKNNNKQHHFNISLFRCLSKGDLLSSFTRTIIVLHRHSLVATVTQSVIQDNQSLARDSSMTIGLARHLMLATMKNT